jgi:hypothetical protein
MFLIHISNSTVVDVGFVTFCIDSCSVCTWAWVAPAVMSKTNNATAFLKIFVNRFFMLFVLTVKYKGIFINTSYPDFFSG